MNDDLSKLTRSSGESFRILSSRVKTRELDALHEFHSKTNYYIDEKFTTQTVGIDERDLEILSTTDTEINPFFGNAIQLAPSQHNTIRRKRSASQFKTNEKLPFDLIESLLSNSFKSDANFNRPYPSAGALYPIEIIICLFHSYPQKKITTGAYHYRSIKNLLQPIVYSDSKDMLESVLSLNTHQYKPSFCLIYLINTLRSLVKYSFRGYRHAFIEVGCMCQQADLVGNNLGLSNRIFSGFNDYEICSFLQIDSYIMIPAVVQAFGIE